MRLAPIFRRFTVSSDSQRILLRYLGVAFLAAAIDWLTKLLVVQRFGVEGGLPISDRFSLLVMFNEGSAGGVMVGPYTWQLNVLVTVVALALITSIVRQLVLVDPRASLALGLVAGGALGNMGSMVLGPPGVADFFAIRLSPDTTIVMNVADAFLWTGALLLIPVAVRLVQAIRTEKRPATVLAKA